MAEATIERSVCGLAEKHGWLVRKVAWIGRRGAPDRLFVKNGRIVLLEFKRERKGVVSPAQSREIKRLLDAGIAVHLCDSVDKGCRILGIPYVAD